MNYRIPDSPRIIDVDFLRKLDADPPGTWLAQPKIDGRRRTCYKIDGQWTYRAKNKDDAAPLPDALREEFESLPWPDGVGLDCEWSGPRDVGGPPMLWVFDLLVLDGQWLGNVPFIQRMCYLTDEIQGAEWFRGRNRALSIRFLHFARETGLFQNPGLVSDFERQKDSAVSEGLVISRADRTLIGSYRHSATPDAGYYKVKFNRLKEPGIGSVITSHKCLGA